MLEALPDLLTRIEPHAVLLALVLPPVIRLVGHWLPEEVFMVAIGVLAARAGSVSGALLLLGAAVLSQFVTDQALYGVGRWLGPRLARFPKIEARLGSVISRLEDSPGALLFFVPARVLPLGRGAWLAGCGVFRIAWKRFIAVDLLALGLHFLFWSGLGWWLSSDLARLEYSGELAGSAAFWLALTLLLALAIVGLRRTFQRRKVVPASRRRP